MYLQVNTFFTVYWVNDVILTRMCLRFSKSMWFWPFCKIADQLLTESIVFAAVLDSILS